MEVERGEEVLSFLVPAVAALQAPENRSSGLRKRQQQNPETLRRIGEHPRSTRLSSPTLSISQLRARFDPEGGRASSSYRFAKTSHCWSCVVERLSALLIASVQEPH